MLNPWPHDDNASLVAFYGDPFSRVFALNLVPFIPPWHMSYKDDNGKVSPVTHFVVHKKILPALSLVFDNIWADYGKSQPAIEADNLHWYGGCYAPRMVRGSDEKYSCHMFAAALDIDPSHNPMNRQHITHMAPKAIARFKEQLVGWGGDFLTRQDPMHFQFAHE